MSRWQLRGAARRQVSRRGPDCAPDTYDSTGEPFLVSRQLQESIDGRCAKRPARRETGGWTGLMVAVLATGLGGAKKPMSNGECDDISTTFPDSATRQQCENDAQGQHLRIQCCLVQFAPVLSSPCLF